MNKRTFIEKNLKCYKFYPPRVNPISHQTFMKSCRMTAKGIVQQGKKSKPDNQTRGVSKSNDPKHPYMKTQVTNVKN